jgi:hypothetical protein
MIIDGRGVDERIPYERLKELLTKEGCFLGEEIEVRLDREKSAERIKILATLVGYESRIESGPNGWTLKVDTSHRRCQ